jgi:hypothetical protein
MNKQIITKINNMSIAEARAINQIALDRIRLLQANARFDFAVGDLVTLDGGNRGKMNGVVEKIMRKNVQVRVFKKDFPELTEAIYNCTPTLLTKRSK